MGLEASIFEINDGSVVMIQEEANHGDLLDHVIQRSYLGEAQAQSLFTQLLSAMRHLHENSVAHHSDLELKLVDFGLCRIAQDLGDDIDAVVDRNGTVGFMSPEMPLSQKPFGGKEADMWAAGVCLFNLLTGLSPIKVAETSCPRFLLINKKCHTLFWQDVDQVLTGIGRPIPSQTAKGLINQLLNVNPSSRLSAERRCPEPPLLPRLLPTRRGFMHDFHTTPMAS
jgi:serine/threonine protein kinase